MTALAMTALADVTDPRFTDDQRAIVARFEAAEVPAEACRTCRGRTRETVGMVCQTCGTDYADQTPDNSGEAGRSAADSQTECDIAEVLHMHPEVTWSEALNLSARVLALPAVVALLDAQSADRAKVARVEALAEWCERSNTLAEPDEIRRALGGTA